MSVQRTRAPEESPTGSHKTLLTCPACGHRSPVDGDWAVTEFATAMVHRRVYECPDCWHTVVVQPVFEDDVEN